MPLMISLYKFPTMLAGKFRRGLGCRAQAVCLPIAGIRFQRVGPLRMASSRGHSLPVRSVMCTRSQTFSLSSDMLLDSGSDFGRFE